MAAAGLRHLNIVLGDQLDARSALWDDFDPERDAVWMAEVDAEIRGSHQQRIVFFLAAMRHFAAVLRDRGFDVHYREVSSGASSFEVALTDDLRVLRPERIRVVLPGDQRVENDLERVAEQGGVPIDVLEDRHFYLEVGAFAEWAQGRKSMVLEHFYRWMRKRHDVLMEDGQPVGGEWNFDADNRKSFGRDGPPADLAPLPRFEPDEVTREVIELVEAEYGDHPGDAARFDLPVTAEQCRAHLDAFVQNGLPRFGVYQDAMAEGDAVLFHSRLSALMNVKLIDPRTCVDAAIDAYARGHAPLNSVEGFVRQILGWREFIRGVYWTFMPDYAELNALGCDDRDVPSFFWDGETDMACVRDAMEELLARGYVHHIHRLMVFGLFAQLFGVHPYGFHRWHMAMYLDAVDWVSLPNTLGMSQFGDGGVVGTKPYVATGKYIQRMGPYCGGCRYDPSASTGDAACPFTTLYWDFLDRHRELLAGNRRMALQMKNLQRKSDSDLEAIRARARWVRDAVDRGERV
jgi:deoxyribodipyrimidine photolyase-related protein